MNLYSDRAPAGDPDDAFAPTLDLYSAGVESRGAVLICPGGGYGGRAAHEGKDVAEAFNAQGLHAFVVQYRVAPNRHPAPLADASRAVRLIRHHADEWHVNADRVAVCGFSAGGHLTASLGVHFKSEIPGSGDAIDALSNRPDALVLSYPVITAGAFRHKGSFKNLLGSDASPEAMDFMSLEKHVTAQTPPTFLWHTAEDAGVPVENSMLFAQALSHHKVPFELHVYPQGRHGLGLAPELPAVATWFGLCATWLKGMGW